MMRVLYSAENIQQRIDSLGSEVTAHYRDSQNPLVALCVLKGSFVFFSDLIRAIRLPLSCEFMGLSSYRQGSESSGEVRVTLDLQEPLEGKDILIVEDIVDTGLTLGYLQESLGARRPASLKTCALLLKPTQLRRDVEIDYVGFEVGDEFVVGYGVDHADRFRHLPDLRAIQI